MNDPYGLIASGLPPELAARLQGISQRDLIARAMLEQSMGPIENLGPPGAKLNFTQGAANMLKAYLGRKNLEASERGRSEIEGERQRLVSGAMNQYQRTRMGAPASPPLTAVDDEGGAMPPVAATPGDPRRAIAEAMVNPLLRGNPLVAADMKAMEKADEPYNLRQGEQRRVGDKIVAENAPKPQDHVIGGKVYRVVDGRVVEVGGPGDSMAFNRPFNADGTPNVAFQQYEKDKALMGSTKVQTNVNSFTPASEEAQKKFMDSTRTTYDALKHAPVALESIDKAKALVPGAAGFVGPGGEGMLQAAKFLNNRLGMNINTEGVRDAEELRTRIFFNIMDNLKKMDAQPSELQQKIMNEALGNLGTDPGALPRVLDAFGDVIRGKVDLHNREVAGAVSRGVKFPYDPTINLEMPKRRASDSSPVLRFDAKGNPIR